VTDCFGIDLEFASSVSLQLISYHARPHSPQIRLDLRGSMMSSPPGISWCWLSRVSCIVFESRSHLRVARVCMRYIMTHPVVLPMSSLPSMTCRNFRWFKLPCSLHNLGPFGPGGSIMLSSRTHASRPRPPLAPATGNQRLAHFGMIPRFRTSRKVCS
jgi:hypothetical protein